ncbi:hypothetical protein ABHI18_004547 [Aspergillus niger]
MAKKAHQRRLLPANEAPHNLESSPAKPLMKRRKLACQNCRKRRVKCVGSRPCESCKRSEIECIFEPHNDRRRKESRHHVESLSRSERVLIQVLQIVRYGPPNDLCDLIGIVKQASTLQDAISKLQMVFQIN